MLKSSLVILILRSFPAENIKCYLLGWPKVTKCNNRKAGMCAVQDHISHACSFIFPWCRYGCGGGLCSMTVKVRLWICDGGVVDGSISFSSETISSLQPAYDDLDLHLYTMLIFMMNMTDFCFPFRMYIYLMLRNICR